MSAEEGDGSLSKPKTRGRKEQIRTAWVRHPRARVGHSWQAFERAVKGSWGLTIEDWFSSPGGGFDNDIVSGCGVLAAGVEFATIATSSRASTRKSCHDGALRVCLSKHFSKILFHNVLVSLGLSEGDVSKRHTRRFTEEERQVCAETIGKLRDGGQKS